MCRLETFWRLSNDVPSPALVPATDYRPVVARQFRLLWRQVKWDNRLNEVYWRLVFNALPLGARMGNNPASCPCWTLGPHDRLHCYWTCPIAEAVKAELRRCLPPGNDDALTGRAPRQLWLMHR